MGCTHCENDSSDDFRHSTCQQQYDLRISTNACVLCGNEIDTPPSTTCESCLITDNIKYSGYS